ncbi:hypothetical protein ACYJ1Y_11545 [Natrialbaceae archaeon A-gly3]
MTVTMRRRTLLGAVAGLAVLAGCMGGNGGDDEDDDGNESAEDEENGEELTDEEIVVLVEEILEEEGLEAVSAEREEDVLEVAYDAIGTSAEAAGLEVEVVADVYTRAINEGLTTERLEASVRNPEDGEVLDTYHIDTEWTEAFLDEEIDWQEYFERVVETFESVEREADLSQDEIVDLFRSTLAGEGIETTAVEQTDNALGVTYVAAGDLETEIDVIADVYVDAVAEGLEIDLLELTRQDSEGSDLDTFTIETAWAEEYLEEELDWEEYVARIEETVESLESEDSDDDDSNDDDSDEDNSEDDENSDEEA